jgi:hypothetical protein
LVVISVISEQLDPARCIRCDAHQEIDCTKRPMVSRIR